MKKTSDIIYNYSSLRGWIKNQFGSEKKYADFLEITPQALNKVLNMHKAFAPHHIIKTKKVFGLTAEQVDAYFFNTEFQN